MKKYMSKSSQRIRRRKRRLKIKNSSTESKSSTSSRKSNCCLPVTSQRLTPPLSLSMTRSSSTATPLKKKRLPSRKNPFSNGIKNQATMRRESKEEASPTKRGQKVTATQPVTTSRRKNPRGRRRTPGRARRTRSRKATSQN